MSKPGFLLEMEIDAEGILLVRLIGRFEFDTWLSQRRRILATSLAGRELTHRHSVIDMTRSSPPEDDWYSTMNRIREELQKSGEGTGLSAFVIGDDAGKASSIRLFQALKELAGARADGIRTFSSFDDAYRWVITESAKDRPG